MGTEFSFGTSNHSNSNIDLGTLTYVNNPQFGTVGVVGFNSLPNSPKNENLEAVMDTLSNHIIDLILENPKKYLLKSEKERS